MRMKKFKQHVFEAFIRQVCCNCEHYQMATHRCLDCKDGEQYLCQSCSSFHNKIKNQKDHRVVEHKNVSAVAVDDKIEKQEIPTAAAIDSATPPSERLKIMSHSVDEASNKPELARKENELFGKREVLDVEYEVFEIQQSGMEQKMCELEEDTKRERDNHERQRHDVKIEVFKSKKTLKEVGKMWIREEANLERLFRKKELENRQEGTMVQLLNFRQAESLYMRDVSLFEELEVFHREKYAGNDTYLQQMLPFLRVKKEEPSQKVLVVRKKIHALEEEEKRINQELNVINEATNSHDAGNVTVTLSFTNDTRPVYLY